MKIKILNRLVIIDILALALVFSILFIQSDIVRIVLGLPFLLFFPGYALTEALFANKDEINGIERLAFSIGMSIAVVALIGFGLNYTDWGIRPEPAVICIFSFTCGMSVIALLRKARSAQGLRWTTKVYIRLPDWQGDIFNRSVSIFLIVCIVGALGVLGYAIAAQKVGETFTELYVLGFDGKAETYPKEFILDRGQVTSVSYAGVPNTTSGWGKVTLGVVNHERKDTTYSIQIKIDGEVVDVNTSDGTVGQLSPIELQQGQKWQQEIGFAPRHIGENQKVEILIYKDDSTTSEDSLSLWINAKEAD